jgi:hypothetical protein
MNSSSTQLLITDGLTTFGTAILVIIASTLTIGIAYLLFRNGWKMLKNSLSDYNYRIGRYDD